MTAAEEYPALPVQCGMVLGALLTAAPQFAILELATCGTGCEAF